MVSRKTDRRRYRYHRTKLVVIKSPFAATRSDHTHCPASHDALQRISQCSHSHHFQHFVETLSLSDLVRQSAVIVCKQYLISRWLSGDISDKCTVRLSNSGGGRPHGCRAFTDQQAVAPLESRCLEQRTPSRLHHFGKCTKHLP